MLLTTLGKAQLGAIQSPRPGARPRHQCHQNPDTTMTSPSEARQSHRLALPHTEYGGGHKNLLHTTHENWRRHAAQHMLWCTI